MARSGRRTARAGGGAGWPATRERDRGIVPSSGGYERGGDREREKRKGGTHARGGGEVTGTKDKDYNIVWFVEQCLSNTLRLETYAKDAERENDRELVEFFRRAQDTSRKGAEQGKALLGKRLTS
jgi:hypothetical protein